MRAAGGVRRAVSSDRRRADRGRSARGRRLRRARQRPDRGCRRSTRTCCVSINTAGKALGVGGAFVAGPAWAIDYLIQRARPFVFSTAPPPAMAAALDASLDDRRATSRSGASGWPAASAHLRDAAARRRRAGAGRRLADHAGRRSATTIARCRVARRLQAQGFDVRAIRPPSVAAGHGAPARSRSTRRSPTRCSTGSPARCRWRCGRSAFRAPRPLRNRHRHRRRQDGRRPRRCCTAIAVSFRCATGSRFRPASSRTTTRRRCAAWRRAARHEVLDERRAPAAAAVAAPGGAAGRPADRPRRSCSRRWRREPRLDALDRRGRRRRAGAAQRSAN